MVNNIKDLKIGDKVEIQSYKHNGSVHRIWRYGIVVGVNDQYVSIVNNRTRVIESSGRIWFTREPAVCYFFKDSWFNIISMLKNNGVHYYCNMASPYIFDGEAIKYVDYDLDLKVFPNKSMKLLDENEYEYHSKLWDYPMKLERILDSELDYLISLVKDDTSIFNAEKVFKDYHTYEKIIKS